MLVKDGHVGSGYDLRRGEAVSNDSENVFSSQLWAQVSEMILNR